MKWLFQISLLCCAVNSCIAQNTFSFKAQVYHSKLGPQKNISVLIDNQYPAVTNDAGVFIVALPKTTSHLKVSLSQTNYTILYPYGGFVLVPKDLNDVPQIIIGNPKENDYLNQYLTLYKLIKNKPSSTTTDPGVGVLKSKLDSLERQLINLHYTESEIRTAKEIQDGKDDYLPEISADLSEFRTKAIDLKTAFKYVSDYAFDNENALQKLVEAITNYNNSYNKLERQQLNYEKRIRDFWQNEELSISFQNLLSFSLDTLHRQTIYPMQEIIVEVRDYFINKNKNAELKKSIREKISARVEQLEVLLPKMEKDNLHVLSLLAQS
jgi:hypothetical protein